MTASVKTAQTVRKLATTPAYSKKKSLMKWNIC